MRLEEQNQAGVSRKRGQVSDLREVGRSSTQSNKVVKKTSELGRILRVSAQTVFLLSRLITGNEDDLGLSGESGSQSECSSRVLTCSHLTSPV